jgi:dihydroxyacetone kinase-like protein
MARRHFVNAPEAIVLEALEGFERAQAGRVRWNREPSYIVRADMGRPDKVGIVSGGGSGHEPLHIGFVGHGMLDVAVPGPVFTSPSSLQVAAGTIAADRGCGVLQIVKNYTGDVLNFNLGAELARESGAQVETVIVDDDLATSADDEGGPGRRGTTGAVVAEKVCGAAAELGMELPSIAALGRRVVSQTRSLSLALEACSRPGQKAAGFEIPSELVEFGVGIHGERGTERRPFGSAQELVASLTSPVVAEMGVGRGDAVLAIVNGLGATPVLELSVAYKELSSLLDGAGVKIARSLVGSFVTSLDMSGISVTISLVDEQIVDLWDARVMTYALSWG